MTVSFLAQSRQRNNLLRLSPTLKRLPSQWVRRARFRPRVVKSTVAAVAPTSHSTAAAPTHIVHNRMYTNTTTRCSVAQQQRFIADAIA